MISKSILTSLQFCALHFGIDKPHLHGGVVGGWVHGLDGGHGCHALVLLNVPTSEEELSVKG